MIAEPASAGESLVRGLSSEEAAEALRLSTRLSLNASCDPTLRTLAEYTDGEFTRRGT
jgi:hypothetical protein